MAKVIRFGLIGCGKMMAAHAKNLNLVEEIEIVACCDLYRDRAEVVAEALGNGAKVYTDYRDMADDVDAVLVATTHETHYEIGMFFATRGKHILMEKPLCNSEEECVRLIEMCEKKNVVLMCAYPVRYWPGVAKLKELVDSGEYGKAFKMSVWTEQLSGTPEVDEYGLPKYLNTSKMGGGQLFSHGCHYVDIMLWFMGEPETGAHVGTNLGTEWMLKEGTSAMIIKFKNGAVGYHGATWGARGTRLDYDIQIHTEKGMLEYEHQSGEIRLYDGAYQHKPGEILERQKKTVLWTRDANRDKQTQYEIRHFAQCVNNGTLPLTNGRAALQSLRVIWALYNAEKNGFMADLRGLGIPEEYQVDYDVNRNN